MPSIKPIFTGAECIANRLYKEINGVRIYYPHNDSLKIVTEDISICTQNIETGKRKTITVCVLSDDDRNKIQEWYCSFVFPGVENIDDPSVYHYELNRIFNELVTDENKTDLAICVITMSSGREIEVIE